MSPTGAIIAACVYLALGRGVMSFPSRLRDVVFSILNVAAVFLFFYWNRETEYGRFRAALFGSYVAMTVTQYLILRLSFGRSNWMSWIAFLTPIIFLIVIRYARAPEMLAFLLPPDHPKLQGHPEQPLSATFVGVSYLAFRTSYLVVEVRNGVIPMPNLWQYLGFAFFLPTLSVGPISPYSRHLHSFTNPSKLDLPFGRAMLRVIVGAVKYRFIGPILNQLTYSGLLLDGHPHPWIDLPIAAVAYYLYLYCNFSGFCDLAVGGAGLMGISVAENFNHPFSARNLQDFWNRWHITLSHYMRDIVFTPLSKLLVRKLGPKRINEVIAITVTVVFLLVGIWHGTGWHYAAFGLAHGFGLAVNHYYSVWLKRRLGKDGFVAYNNNRFIHAIAVAITFTYVTICLFLFANDGEAMAEIFAMLRWGSY